jgi:EmrB/QacA subfamily drug resistance transporter
VTTAVAGYTCAMPGWNEFTATLRRPSMQIALIVASAMFMQNLDSTIIVTALPAMAHTFATTESRVSEGITAYALAAAICIPSSAWLAGRIGTRTLFCGAIALFTLASVACGLAHDFTAFIAARLVQGGSAAMMSPVGRLVVLRNTAKHELMGTLSALVWPALLAPVIGPALGGFITEALNWRWIFYVNVPIGVLAMALVLALIPNHMESERTAFDIRGFLLLALAVGCLSVGLDVLGGKHIEAWLALGLLGAAAAAGYAALRHLESTPAPLIRLDVMRRPAFRIAMLSGGGPTRAAISATPFLLPIMLEVVYGLTPLQAGVLLLVYMLANLLMKTVTNPIIRRFGLRPVLIVNGAITAAGIAACAWISPQLPMALTVIILLFAGASRSMQFTAITFTTFAEVSPEERAPASVLSSLIQQITMAAGVASSALILNFSRLLRHARALGALDFRVALTLMAVLAVFGLIGYAALPKDTGAELSGRGPGAAS